MSTLTTSTALTTLLVSSSALLKAVQNAQMAAPANNPIVPILETLLLSVVSQTGQYGTSSSLTVTGYDLEHRFTSRPLPLERRDTDNAALCVPGKQLIELLRNLEDQPLTVKLLDHASPNNGSLHINAALTHSLLVGGSGSARYEFAGENAADYPREIALGRVNPQLRVPGHVLLAGLSATLPVTTTDELRPAMTGVLITVTKDKLEFAATDGHRLVVMTKQDQHESDGFRSFILPRKACEILLKLVDKREMVEVVVGATQALFKLDKGELQVRLIDEKYPDFHSVIPVSNPNVLVVHRLELLAAVKRMLLFSNKTTYQLKFELEEGTAAKIKAEDLDYKNTATESMPGTYTGQPLDIGFNARFLRFFLEKLPCQSVKFSMSIPSRAAILQSADADDGLLCLLMPVMLNNYN